MLQTIDIQQQFATLDAFSCIQGPKARPITAQGIALGTGSKRKSSPERAIQNSRQPA
jgi:hypothetical protein